MVGVAIVISTDVHRFAQCTEICKTSRNHNSRITKLSSTWIFVNHFNDTTAPFWHWTSYFLPNGTELSFENVIDLTENIYDLQNGAQGKDEVHTKQSER